MLAHELRNPLVPIMTGLKTFQMIDPDPKLQRARDAMERQVRHMVRLVDDLLDVSRVTAGKIELRKDLVDVATIVQQAVQTSQPQWQEKQHALDLALPREPPRADRRPGAPGPDRVSNLLSNAAKYTDVGGAHLLRAVSIGELVEIRVKRQRPRDPPGDAARRCSACSCSPTAPSTWPRAASASASRWSSAWSSSTAARSARSEGEGTGSEFIVRLPRRAASSPVRAAGRRRGRGGGSARGAGCSDGAPVPTPASPAAKLEPRRLRILVVDDNPDIRSTLHDLLEMLGHAVEVAEDGAEALERVRERPDVALVDIGLPGMDGCEVARTLRPTRRACPRCA
jgi:hypothetical protein